jgi:DNA-binding HxlR family transcriptional regulator
MASRILIKDRLLRLLDSKWAVPVLAELHRGSMGLPARAGGGARSVTLLNRLGITPSTLSRTIEALLREGLVARHPGYGHPLRPDFTLTRRGIAVAEACLEVVTVFTSAGVPAADHRKWMIPALLALARGHSRFSDLRGALGGITPRALTQVLKRLEEAGFIDRRISDDYPPRVTYEIGPRGEKPAHAAARLAQSAA